MIIRQLDRASVGAAVLFDRARRRRGERDGGSDMAVMTARPGPGCTGFDPLPLGLSVPPGRGRGPGREHHRRARHRHRRAGLRLRERGDRRPGPPGGPVSMDLSGLTFCDASGLGVLARMARHARQAGGQLRLISARPAVLKIIRLTGLDRSYPSWSRPVRRTDPPTGLPRLVRTRGRDHIAAGVKFGVLPAFHLNDCARRKDPHVRRSARAGR